MEVDKKLSGHIYRIKSACKRRYFNLGNELNGVPRDQYLNSYCFQSDIIILDEKKLTANP